MSEKEKEYFVKLQRVQNKMRGLKYMFRGIFGMSEIPMREQLREVAKGLKERKQRPQKGNILQPQNGQPMGSNIKERFSNRPRLMDFFQQPQEAQAPESRLDPITQEAILEKRKQLAEEHKARAKREKEEEETKRIALARKRARENIGIHSA